MLAAIALLAACGVEAGAPVRAASRDSAGITIVENAGPLAPDSVAFQVDSAPALEIGGGGGPHTEFSGIAGLVMLSDGGVAVADRGAGEIRIFGSSGAWRRSQGRRGGGPGEFEGLIDLFASGGDTLVAYDWAHRRISVFSPAGTVMREVTVNAPGFPTLIGPVDRHRFLVSVAIAGASGVRSGIQRDTMILALYSESGSLDTLARLLGSEQYVDLSGEGALRQAIHTSLPFGITLAFGASHDRLFAGTSDRYEIWTYDLARKPLRLIRRGGQAAPVTARDVAIEKEAQLKGFRAGNEGFREKVRSLLERIPYPGLKPRFDGFVVGDDGSLWVEQFRGRGNLPVRYDVFDPAGQWLGHVTFPARFSLYHAGPGYALGVWTDADEVERVRRYHLTPIPR